MRIATKIISNIHGVIIIIIFFLLFGTAGLSLFALSPISIEEYAAYKLELAEYNLRNNQDQKYIAGEVAGQFTSNSDVEINRLYYLDLGQEKKFNYKLLSQSNQLDYQLSLTPEFRDSNPKLPLLELHNRTNKLETYRLMLTNNSADTFLAGITTDVTSLLKQVENITSDITYINDIAAPQETRTYEFSLLPEQKSTLILISERIPTVNSGTPLLVSFNINRTASNDIVSLPANLNLNRLP